MGSEGSHMHVTRATATSPRQHNGKLGIEARAGFSD